MPEKPKVSVGEEALRIFRDLRECPPSELEERLLAECGERNVVFDVVWKMFAHQAAKEAARAMPPTKDPEETLGPYQVVLPLGVGGTGEVYLAIRIDDGSKRTDAVKVLRRGATRPDILIRAEREGHLLQGIQHRNFPQYRDHGHLPDGRPYLAMQYIHGQPIHRYCQQKKLGTRARLQVFLEVCEAVALLHQKNILHRDLKPGNILVTETGIPKVLDFGIAKFMGPDGAAEQTLTAAQATPLYTPNYASPEQIAGRPLGQTSDVYSLGVVLYEFLTGQAPLDLSDLIKTPEALLKRVLEDDPAAPSAVVAEGKSSALIDPDLDAIVLKALRRESSRRYPAVVLLALDIERLLDGHPVEARQGTRRYVVRKFLRRNWLAVSFAATVLLGSLGFGAATYLQNQEILQERELSEQVLNVLVDILQTTDPDETRKSPKEILDEGFRKVQAGLADRPRAKARILSNLSWIYLQWNEYQLAKEMISEALEIQQSILPHNHKETARSLFILGTCQYHFGEVEESKTTLKESLRMKQAVLGKEHPEISDELNLLALIAHKESRFQESEELNKKAIELRTVAASSDSPDVAVLQHNMGSLYQSMMRYPESLERYQAALDIYTSAFGSEHPKIATVLNGMASLHKTLGQYEEAEERYLEAIRIRRKVFGDDDYLTSISLNNYGLFLVQRERFTEAVSYLQEALRIQKTVFGDEGYQVGAGLNNLGMALQGLGEFSTAEEFFLSALSIWDDFPWPHQFTVNAKKNLGAVYRQTGRYEKANRILEESLQGSIELFGDNHVTVATILREIGLVMMATGQTELARSLLEESWQIRRNGLGETHESTVRTLVNLAELEWRENDLSRSQQLFEESLGILLNTAAGQNPLLLAETKKLYAGLLVEQGNYSQALRYAQEADDTFSAALPQGHWQQAAAQSIQALISRCTGSSPEASTTLSDSYETLSRTLGESAVPTQRARERLTAKCPKSPSA